VVKRIVHKHVSVGIRAEHYPIVGHHLLGAIAETLGDAATQPLLDAWAEAYTSLAKLLIAAEAEMYSTAGIEPGETRPMRVTEVTRESENVLSIRFVPTTSKPLPPFKAGQYVSVAVDLPDGRHQLRQYSLSDAPGVATRQPAHLGQARRWRRDAGRRSLELAAPERASRRVLQVSHPFGEFTPDTESDGRSCCCRPASASRRWWPA
jgi:nitric oxide dioxygenase